MKIFFTYFLRQRMVKALLIVGTLLMSWFSAQWSADDCQLNMRPMLYLACVVLVLMFGYWLAQKVQQWRTGKK